MTAYPELLATIARLSRALIAQEDVTSETATARRELIRQAIAQGYTLQAIGDMSGLSRQRVSQLAKDVDQ